jgi:ATP-dependent exoDNAse (exonuclease V) beta subunit
VDLLLKLRNLLVDRHDVRGDYQGLFDHIFVDEFQDTDPLQAEIQTLAAEGITGPTGPSLRVEYPVAGPAPGSLLLTGYVDLVAVSDERVTVIDFKTDGPPSGAVEDTYPQYVAQVRAYAALLTASLGLRDGQVPCGLLFTAAGRSTWL